MKVPAVMMAAAVIAALAVPAFAADPAPSHTVSQAQFDQWKTQFSNAGRWGKDDEIGTLNLITAAKRKAAAALVKDGVSVSMARDTDSVKAPDNPQPFEHTMNPIRPMVATDGFAMQIHGFIQTHLDALSHHFLDGKMYNGFPQADVVAADGAHKGAITNLRDGIFTRGILVDLPLLKGVEYLEPGTPIYTEDLEAWEKMAHVKIQPGDALFIRTGRWVRRAKTGPWDIAAQSAGLDASVVPWLKAKDLAVIGSESGLSVTPIPGSSHITNPDDYLPVHNFVLVTLGLHVIDDCDLDALAKAAAARRRWEFLFTAAPLRIEKGTGSPINPIATF